MPRRPKRPPWNHDLDLSVPGKPLPPRDGPPLVGHSTAHFMPEPERWHVVELLADGTRQVYEVGGHPWVGSQRLATVEAQRLTRETGRPHEAVDSAQLATGPAR